MSLLLGELAPLVTTGDMQTDAKSTLQLYEGANITQHVSPQC